MFLVRIAPVVLILLAAFAPAQEQKQPPVRLNILNVCAPTDAERNEIAAALAVLPEKPRFGPEFEVARGHTLLPDSGSAHWVRLRREFPSDSHFLNAQYSFSVESASVTETLVVRLRDPKDVVQVSIEDSVSGGPPSAVLATDTPASRVKVERFGKGFLVLARCPQANQSALEPLFRRATALMSSYRAALGTRTTVPAELAHLTARARPRSTTPAKPPGRKP